jgi:hypothetical protein
LAESGDGLLVRLSRRRWSRPRCPRRSWGRCDRCDREFFGSPRFGFDTATDRFYDRYRRTGSFSGGTSFFDLGSLRPFLSQTVDFLQKPVDVTR